MILNINSIIGTRRDIARELRDIANLIEDNYHSGLTCSGTSWHISDTTESEEIDEDDE